MTESGNKRVKVYGTGTSWVAGKHEAYSMLDGRRNGSPTSPRRILLDTLRELEKPAEKAA